MLSRNITSACPELPFAWLLVNKLNSLYDNSHNQYFNQPNSDNPESFTISDFLTNMSNILAQQPFYHLLLSVASNHRLENIHELILNAYIHDFILINSKAYFRQEIDQAVRLFKHELDNSIADPGYLSDSKLSLPLVHYVFDKCKVKIETLLSFSQFDPRILEIRY